ncbi:MAG: MFS transporter [Candidatus Eiseniibacteriota bacterium]
MRLPNLLATPRRRLFAFFLLYMAEGIPNGFTGTAVATQMRRGGLDPAAIGAFIGALYLPWALKWTVGPVVDVISSDRWGRRRLWILLTQSAMVVTLLCAAPVDYAGNLGLFTTILLVLNIFSATQDVAIDALAVNVLTEHERGLANGLMFGGAYLGGAVGGAGVLFLTPHVGFQTTFFFVAAVIAVITLVVAVPMRELPGPPRPPVIGSRLAAVGRDIAAFAHDAFRAFIGTRAALLAVGVAMLPIGAYALGLALQSNLAVELGLDDTRIGWLSLWSTILSSVFCVVGGWLSDKLGRRRMLSLFVAGMCVMTAVLAFGMKSHGWIMPVDPTLPDRPQPPEALVSLFWTVVLIYSAFNGLMYGTSTALFMDVTTPRVAATQFTAYMAMGNLAISYSANWQGHAAERWGYPVTLGLDAVLGLACLAFLPFMALRKKSAAPHKVNARGA